MVKLPGRGFENFLTFVLPHLVGTKRVNLIISPIFHRDGSDVEKIQFYISYLTSDQMTAFELNTNDLADDQLVKEPKQWFLKRYIPVAGNPIFDFRSNIQAGKLWKTKIPIDPRYPTDEPHEFLCKNNGQYSPWWSEETWDRCGKSIDDAVF